MIGDNAKRARTQRDFALSWLPSRNHVRMASCLRLVLVLVLGSLRLFALEVGERIPELTGLVWIKGHPLVLHGKFTVLDIWSTTDPGDSIEHLTALQHRLSDRVQVLGLSRESADAVHSFVDDQGADMDYQVAVLPAPVLAGLLRQGQQEPWRMIIDQTGTLAWSGHPADLDSMLDRMLCGSANAALMARIAPLQHQLDHELDPAASPDSSQERFERALKISARILAIDPINLPTLLDRLWLSSQVQRPGIARATLSALPIDRLSAGDADTLARSLLDAEDPTVRFPEFAYACAVHARALDPTVAAYHSTCARLLEEAGLLPEAIAEEQHAVLLNPEDDVLAGTLGYYEALSALRATMIKDLHPGPAVTTVTPPAPVPLRVAVPVADPVPVPASNPTSSPSSPSSPTSPAR